MIFPRQEGKLRGMKLSNPHSPHFPSPSVLRMWRMRRSALCLLAAMTLTSGWLMAQTAGHHDASVNTKDFSARIDGGWLVAWTNKKTGETFSFGKPADEAQLPPFYRPGPWVIPGYDQEKKESQWSLEASSPAADTLSLKQNVQVTDGWAQTVQWSIRIPFDQIDAVHWQRGIAPSRILGAGALNKLAIYKSYYFSNRTAELLYRRYYVIQGKKGGLVIYMDDPELEHFTAVEADTSKQGEVIFSNRSLGAPPWEDHYQSGKWMIVQYEGAVARGAGIYRDYLVNTFHPVPLDQRPTAWVQNLVWTYVGMPWARPQNYAGLGALAYNYAENWEQNLQVAEQWLKNLSQVLDPNKVMFYGPGWRVAGHDTMFPEHSVDPFFAMMAHKARKMGFHVCLHVHAHLVQDMTTFYSRLVAKQDEWNREAHPNRPKAVGDPEGKVPWGVGFDFVRRMEVVQRDKKFGGVNTSIQGLPVKMTGYHMSPGYEGWRYMKVAEILSALRATEADAVHLDVPNPWPEGKERYGMNSLQGIHEFYKLLRKTLDENGLAHVAIATEASPGDANFTYVDLAQNMRGNSIISLLEGQFGGEDLLELQLGNQYEQTLSLRAAVEQQKKDKRFNVDVFRQLLSRMRELGEPNLDAMVYAGLVRSYPHLGAMDSTSGGYPGDPAASLHNTAAQVLNLWYTLQKGATFNSGVSYQMFMDVPPWDTLEVVQQGRKKTLAERGSRKQGKMFNQFDYAAFALARWWEKYEPHLALPSEWEARDIARYRLNDGRALSVQRTQPLELSLVVDGKLLASLDVFGGWKDNESLVREFGPTWLRNQLED